jgi:hypothetical protein
MNEILAIEDYCLTAQHREITKLVKGAFLRVNGPSSRSVSSANLNMYSVLRYKTTPCHSYSYFA